MASRFDHAALSDAQQLASQSQLGSQSQLYALLRQYGGTEPGEHATQLIKRVHDDALVEYRITKKRKQQQLACKIADAQRCGDRLTLKTEKKKVANHASAVASRVKQEFIVSSFESMLKHKVLDAFRLSDVLYRHMVLLADKDEHIRRLSEQVALLSQQLRAPMPQHASLPSLSPLPQHSSQQQHASLPLPLQSLPLQSMQSQPPPPPPPSQSCGSGSGSGGGHDAVDGGDARVQAHNNNNVSLVAMWAPARVQLDELFAHGALDDDVTSGSGGGCSYGDGDDDGGACAVRNGVHGEGGGEALVDDNDHLRYAKLQLRERSQHVPERQQVLRHALLLDAHDVSLNPVA